MRLRFAARARRGRHLPRRAAAQERPSLAGEAGTAVSSGPQPRQVLSGQQFDPYAILAALERQGVGYILIGGFARVIQGTEELTHGLDLVPSTRGENLRRLALALEDLGAERVDDKRLLLDESTIRDEPLIELQTSRGELKVVPEPAGTRGGYDDLRRAATREPLGKGLRPSVASIGDLARMLAALGREQDLPQLEQLRRLRELERSLSRGLER